MTEPIIPLIMCGGAGTRLWPASREGRPKQFLRLFGPRSTFQETIRRVSDADGVRTADRRHQSSVPISGRRAARRDRRRGRHPARAASPRFRAGDRRRRGACAAAGRRADRARACRRPCRDRCRRASSPPAAPRAIAAERRIHRDVRCHAGSAGDRIRLYPSRQELWSTASSPPRSSSRSPTRRRRAATVADGYLWNSGNLMFRARARSSTNIAASMPASAAAVTAAVEGAGSDLGFITLKAG